MVEERKVNAVVACFGVIIIFIGLVTICYYEDHWISEMIPTEDPPYYTYRHVSVRTWPHQDVGIISLVIGLAVVAMACKE